MAAQRENRNEHNFNVRIGHQTSPWSLIANNSAGDSNDSSDSRASQRQAMRTFLDQKPHRVHQSIVLRRILYIILTSLAMILAWAIGYYDVSVLALVCVVIVVIIVWTDQAKKLALITEQEIEMKVRRKRTVHVSETAEWVNLAINRWWMTCSDSIIGFLKDYIEPLLQEVVPPGIDSLEMLEFDLANQTPFVKSIQIFEPPVLSPTPATIFMTPSSSSSKTVLAANMDIGLIAPDSKLTMKVRVGGKRLGYDTLVYVEGLHLSGSMQAIIHIDYEAPFPHIACISATFVRRPDLWFSIRVMKGLKVTDIPLVRTWVHSFVMNIFQSLLVDPGRLEIDLMSAHPSSVADPSSSRRARGVLTVSFSGSPPEESSKYEEDPRRWATFRLGTQKHHLQIPTGRDNWAVTHSFLVYDLKEDQIVVKIKHRRIMYTMELAAHNIPLTVLGLQEDTGDGTEGRKSMYFHNTESNIRIDMEYSSLQPFSLNTPSSAPPTHQVAGVLYIHVHSATDLLSSDVDGLSDPYCVVLTNKTKVLTTHYILDTLNPKWERGIEIFVRDFTQTSLSFLVYDWDGPLVGDDFLGAAKLDLSSDEPQVLQKPIELEIDGTTNKKGRSLGKIIVSVVFRPVDSVAKADLPSSSVGLPQGGGNLGVPSSTSATTSRRGSKQAWKKLGGIQPGKNYGVIELSLVSGRHLVGMDRNGLSDPYIIVKYGINEVCRTPVVNKTLNPQWNCNYTLPAPPTDVPIVFECWDKDQFSSDDFMGSLAFSSNSLQMFENGPQWCRLEHVQTGEILLELKKQEPCKPPSQDSLSSGDISTLDEASKHLMERGIQDEERRRSLNDERQNNSTTPYNENTPSSSTESSILLSVPKQSLSHSSPNLSNNQLPLPSVPVINTEQTDSDERMQSVRRRRPDSSLVHRTPSIGSGDSSLSAHSGILSMTIAGTDLQSELRHSRQARNRGSMSETRSESGFPLEPLISAFYYNVQGEIVEADGLRGKLDHLELYIKIRLNSHPSYLRRQKFERGSVIHKARKLRGSSILKWKESFVVKENPIPSDSLLTIDLKSGPNVTLGTHVITLDKMFEGNLSATKWLDLGNSMRVMIQMTRIPAQGRSMDLGSLRRNY